MLKFLKKKSVDGAGADACVNAASVPQHIAFICDGNRRWAKEHGLPPLMGHEAGIANFEACIDWFLAHGVSTVSFWIFSTENWDRSKEEIDFLMNRFYSVMKENMKHAIEKNLRYRVIGSRERIPAKLAKICDELEEKSAAGTAGTVVFALNYGGKDEIVRAVNAAIAIGKPVDKESFESLMDTGDLLPIDMVMRTSGESRISNFMLWKLAYAELYFPPYAWPEFVGNPKHWESVLHEFARRTRRFGGGVEENYSGNKS